MSNTHDDLTRELYRRMSNKELCSLRDKVNLDSQHAPFILGELRRRGLSTTPQPFRYNPVRQPIERRQIATRGRQGAPQAPTARRAEPPQAFGAQQIQKRIQKRLDREQHRQDVVQQRVDAAQQRVDAAQQRQAPSPPRQSAGQTAPPRRPQQSARPPQAKRPYIKPVKSVKEKKQGCGCVTTVIMIIIFIIIRMLLER